MQHGFQKLGRVLFVMLVGMIIVSFAVATEAATTPATKVSPVAAKTTVKAAKEIKKFTVTVSVTGEGTTVPEKATVREGNSKSFKFVPKAGQKIADVKLDGQSVMNDVKISKKGNGAYKLAKVASDHQIEVSFAKK
jgi:hypothetical protein